MKILFTALVALILQLFLPWWSIAFAAFTIAIFYEQTGVKSFLNGFAAIFILWVVWAGSIHFINDGVLANRLANLLFLPFGFLSVILTGLIGGITGGLAALTGNRLRLATRKN